MSDQQADAGGNIAKILFLIALSAVPLMGWLIGMYMGSLFLQVSIRGGWFLRWLFALGAGAALAVAAAYGLSWIGMFHPDKPGQEVILAISITLAPSCILTTWIAEMSVNMEQARA